MNFFSSSLPAPLILVIIDMILLRIYLERLRNILSSLIKIELKDKITRQIISFIVSINGAGRDDEMRI